MMRTRWVSFLFGKMPLYARKVGPNARETVEAVLPHTLVQGGFRMQQVMR